MPTLSAIRITKTVVERAARGSFTSDAEVRGFGLRVSNAGSRSFVVSYRTHSGKQGRTTLGSYPTLTVDQARELARKQLAIVEAGGNPSEDRRRVRNAATMSDMADHYCGDYASARKLAPRTVSEVRQLFDRFLIPMIGSQKVADVTTPDLRQVQGKTHDVAGKYQSNRLMRFISKLFSLSIEMKLRQDNPCSGIKLYDEDQRWRNFSDTELAALFKAMDEDHDQDEIDAIRLLLFTGARLQEVLKADWSQFNFDVGVWEKPSANVKRGEQHRLELAGPALALLIDMKKKARHPTFLFPGRDGTKPRVDLKAPWNRVVKAAGLSDARRHDLRRTLASVMLSGGAALATVGKALNHTQPSTTARYAQLAPSIQRSDLGNAGERMQALSKPVSGAS